VTLLVSLGRCESPRPGCSQRDGDVAGRSPGLSGECGVQTSPALPRPTAMMWPPDASASRTPPRTPLLPRRHEVALVISVGPAGPQFVTCPTCGGAGKTSCPTCGGRGTVSSSTACSTCGGSGGDQYRFHLLDLWRQRTCLFFRHLLPVRRDRQGPARLAAAGADTAMTRLRLLFVAIMTTWLWLAAPVVHRTHAGSRQLVDKAAEIFRFFPGAGVQGSAFHAPREREGGLRAGGGDGRHHRDAAQRGYESVEYWTGSLMTLDTPRWSSCPTSTVDGGKTAYIKGSQLETGWGWRAGSI